MCSLSDFCTVDGEEQALWQRVTSYAQDMYAMKDVFAMDSTVRVDAIENLGIVNFYGYCAHKNKYPRAFRMEGFFLIMFLVIKQYLPKSCMYVHF